MPPVPAAGRRFNWRLSNIAGCHWAAPRIPPSRRTRQPRCQTTCEGFLAPRRQDEGGEGTARLNLHRVNLGKNHKSGVGCFCRAAGRQANEGRGEKKQRGATKNSPTSRFRVCAVASRLDLTRAEGWSTSRRNQSVSNLIGICSLNTHKGPHTAAVLELNNARTFAPADRGSDTDRRGGLHHSGARQPGPEL